VITKWLAILRKYFARIGVLDILVAAGEACGVFFLAQQHGLWPLAALLVLGVELGINRAGARIRDLRDLKKFLIERTAVLVVGLSIVMIIAVLPRLATQVSFAVIYAVWRIWWSGAEEKITNGLPALLAVNAIAFEAIFLMAAVWRTSEWVVLALVWASTYTTVYALLSHRDERIAGIMAATWALVCTEISWVLLRWLFTYTVTGGHILVPQPVLILTALGYCFGSTYVAQ
jgi:hypothetical protein